MLLTVAQVCDSTSGSDANAAMTMSTYVCIVHPLHYESCEVVGTMRLRWRNRMSSKFSTQRRVSYVFLSRLLSHAGNMVVDSLMESYFNLPYDSDGQIVSLVWMAVQSVVL